MMQRTSKRMGEQMTQTQSKEAESVANREIMMDLSEGKAGKEKGNGSD